VNIFKDFLICWVSPPLSLRPSSLVDNLGDNVARLEWLRGNRLPCLILSGCPFEPLVYERVHSVAMLLDFTR